MSYEKRQMLFLTTLSMISLFTGLAFYIILGNEEAFQHFWIVAGLLLSLGSFYYTAWLIEKLRKEMQKQ